MATSIVAEFSATETQTRWFLLPLSVHGHVVHFCPIAVPHCDVVRVPTLRRWTVLSTRLAKSFISSACSLLYLMSSVSEDRPLSLRDPPRVKTVLLICLILCVPNLCVVVSERDCE